jgi:hypothetical protein
MHGESSRVGVRRHGAAAPRARVHSRRDHLPPATPQVHRDQLASCWWQPYRECSVAAAGGGGGAATADDDLGA